MYEKSGKIEVSTWLCRKNILCAT